MNGFLLQFFSGFRAQFYYDNPAAAKTKRTSKYAASAESESLSTSAGNKFQWPSSNWTTDIALVPKVTTEVILGHLLKTSKSTPGDDTVVLVQKPLTRGYDFYFGGYMHSRCEGLQSRRQHCLRAVSVLGLPEENTKVSAAHKSEGGTE